ncbi:DsrE family protein [Sulfurimonas sp. HSL3-2]|uniref:DsrE family protein n=1 Tax=Hydrocurvibacter mobilis TaxID=3131936 RepID=UPI0031F99215
MKKLLLLLAFFSFLNAEEGIKKVVFDLTTGDLKVFEKKVLSGIAHQKSYYEGKMEELQAAVVIHGDAYKFFVKDVSSSPFKDDKELQKESTQLATRISSLVETYDVEFLMCNAGMKSKNIKKENIFSFVKIVPNSTIGLIDKQNEGYAYIPIAK